MVMFYCNQQILEIVQFRYWNNAKLGPPGAGIGSRGEQHPEIAD